MVRSALAVCRRTRPWLDVQIYERKKLKIDRLIMIMPGFALKDIETSGATIRLRHGGEGPPLLLLHGNPMTHVAGHKVAPRLA